ncbi:MAG: ferredoxin [Candidatus Aenigmarchaeota archaeon]|nr:ferredoxin [Candidatus Aenigmarchaeota archaeon]
MSDQQSASNGVFKFYIDHDRPNCIGCGACVAVAPEFWEIKAADGKSDVIGSEKQEENGEVVREVLNIAETNYAKNKEAADSCPVNVIHIVNKETKEQVI